MWNGTNSSPSVCVLSTGTEMSPLIAGDTARLVRERAELLAGWCDVDPEAVWQWGFIERVSTGLANLRDFDNDDGATFLEVARRCL